jgi:hypothetical protein
VKAGLNKKDPVATDRSKLIDSPDLAKLLIRPPFPVTTVPSTVSETASVRSENTMVAAFEKGANANTRLAKVMDFNMDFNIQRLLRLLGHAFHLVALLI